MVRSELFQVKKPPLLKCINGSHTQYAKVYDKRKPENAAKKNRTHPQASRQRWQTCLKSHVTQLSGYLQQSGETGGQFGQNISQVLALGTRV